MSVETLRAEVARRARDFAWDQWTQLGVSGPPPSHKEQRAADPESLLLVTFEVGRHDPRLFDEVLDWLVVNEQLVSVQRLRNLCLDAEDRELVDASLNWVAQWRPRPRLSGRASPTHAQQVPRPLFHGLAAPPANLDQAFEKHGLLRARLEPSGKSQRPDLHAPINFALRMRRFLGLGVRAEVVRVLLTADALRVAAGVLYASAGFTRQNVRESLNQLQDAGVVAAAGRGSHQVFSIRRDDWLQLLNLAADRRPLHHDWIETLGALRLILRWLHEPRVGELSDYMLASEARTLVERLEPDLRFAGVSGQGSARGADYWGEFERIVDELLATL